jgi:hypothetical protein
MPRRPPHARSALATGAGPASELRGYPTLSAEQETEAMLAARSTEQADRRSTTQELST